MDFVRLQRFALLMLTRLVMVAVSMASSSDSGGNLQRAPGVLLADNLRKITAVRRGQLGECSRIGEGQRVVAL